MWAVAKVARATMVKEMVANKKINGLAKLDADRSPHAKLKDVSVLLMEICISWLQGRLSVAARDEFLSEKVNSKGIRNSNAKIFAGKYQFTSSQNADSQVICQLKWLLGIKNKTRENGTSRFSELHRPWRKTLGSPERSQLPIYSDWQWTIESACRLSLWSEKRGVVGVVSYLTISETFRWSRRQKHPEKSLSSSVASLMWDWVQLYSRKDFWVIEKSTSADRLTPPSCEIDLVTVFKVWCTGKWAHGEVKFFSIPKWGIKAWKTLSPLWTKSKMHSLILGSHRA